MKGINILSKVISFQNIALMHTSSKLNKNKSVAQSTSYQPLFSVQIQTHSSHVIPRLW